MIFAIPSYKRSDKQDTLAFLHRMGVPQKDIYIFVQTQADYDLYSARYAGKCEVVYHPADGIAGARNNILNHFNGADDIMMLDDDVSCIAVGAKGEKFREIEAGQFMDIVRRMFSVTMAAHGNMFGLYPVYNEFFMSNDISTKVTVNTILGFPKGFGLRFDEGYRAKEDLELCGRILSSGGRVIRFNNLAFKAKHRTNAGGANEAWHSDLNEQISNRLALIYPDVFAVRSNNHSEVRVVLRDAKLRGVKWLKN